MGRLGRVISGFLVGMGVLCCLPSRAPIIHPERTGTEEVREYHYVADTDFTVQERQMLQEAADMWNGFSNGQVHITVTYELNWKITESIVYAANYNTIVRNECSNRPDIDSNVLGWAPPLGGMYGEDHRHVRMMFCMDRMNPQGDPAIPNDLQYFQQAAIHEFGHGLGLEHVDDRNAMMYKSTLAYRQACLTRADMIEFCRVITCTQKVRWCGQ